MPTGARAEDPLIVANVRAMEALLDEMEDEDEDEEVDYDEFVRLHTGLTLGLKNDAVLAGLLGDLWEVSATSKTSGLHTAAGAVARSTHKGGPKPPRITPYAVEPPPEVHPPPPLEPPSPQEVYGTGSPSATPRSSGKHPPCHLGSSPGSSPRSPGASPRVPLQLRHEADAGRCERRGQLPSSLCCKTPPPPPPPPPPPWFVRSNVVVFLSCRSDNVVVVVTASVRLASLLARLREAVCARGLRGLLHFRRELLAAGPVAPTAEIGQLLRAYTALSAGTLSGRPTDDYFVPWFLRSFRGGFARNLRLKNARRLQRTSC